MRNAYLFQIGLDHLRRRLRLRRGIEAGQLSARLCGPLVRWHDQKAAEALRLMDWRAYCSMSVLAGREYRHG